MPGGEPSDRLRLQYRADGGVAIVDADGEIDVFTCGSLRDRLLALVDEGHSGLVVNLGKVSFIDSAGLGVLVAVWHRLRPFDGVLALAAPSPGVRGVSDAAGLTKAISIYETTAEAVQACIASSPRWSGRLRRGQMRHD